jgi:hypothetical protein
MDEKYKLSIVGEKVDKVVQRFVDSGMFLRQCYQTVISSHDTGLDMEALYHEIVQETYRYPYHFTIMRLSENHEYYILEVS